MKGSTGAMHRRSESNSAPGPAQSMAGIVKNSLSSGAFQYEALSRSSSTCSSVGVNSLKSRLEDHGVQCGCGPFLGFRARLLGGGHRSASALTAGTVNRAVNSLKSRVEDHVVQFSNCRPSHKLRAKQLRDGNPSPKVPGLVTATGNISKSCLDDHVAHCSSCGPFLGLRARQLRERNRTLKTSGQREGEDETADPSFIFRLLASCERLRESIKQANLNAYDLFVGNQIVFLMTASPVIPRAKAPLPGSSSRRLSVLPVTSISTPSSTLGQEINYHTLVESHKSSSRSRGRDYTNDRRLQSFRR